MAWEFVQFATVGTDDRDAFALVDAQGLNCGGNVGCGDGSNDRAAVIALEVRCSVLARDRKHQAVTLGLAMFRVRYQVRRIFAGHGTRCYRIATRIARHRALPIGTTLRHGVL